MLLQFKRLKHILLKYYIHENTKIIINGAINTDLYIENTKILIDNKKIMLSNGDNQNIIIDLQDINKIEIINKWHMILKNRFLTIDIQQ